jgi:hypothetical protein
VHYSALKGQAKSQAAFILSLDALQIAQQLCLVEQANFLVINYHGMEFIHLDGLISYFVFYVIDLPPFLF